MSQHISEIKLSSIPVLDGVRGFAILIVMIAHFNGEEVLKSFFPTIGPFFTKIALSGLMGVDLFFLLSGFLITRILLASRYGAHYLLNFYARRFLRIFPLYYLAIILVFFILPSFIKFDDEARYLSEHQWWLWAYLGNLPGSPNWDSSSIIKMGHFWTLAVEEHFYLVWPFVVMSLSPDRLKKLCLTWTVVSMLLGVIDLSYGSNMPAIFGWTTIKFSGCLTLGAYLAVSYCEEQGLSKFQPYAEKILPFIGIAFLACILLPRNWAAVFVFITHCVSWFLFFTLFIVILTANKTHFLVRFFTLNWLRFFGKLSYGLYVYHGIFRPVFERLFDRYELINFSGSPFVGVLLYFAITIGASVLMAWVSWHCFEKFFLTFKKLFSSRNDLLPKNSL